MKVPVVSIRTILRNVIPGTVMPGIVYFAASQQLPVVASLAIASCVPVMDTVVRMARGKKPSTVGMIFLSITALSIALASVFDSPTLIVGKGVLLTFIFGSALAVSAAAGRPLTRTIALHLCAEPGEQRQALAERWERPQTLAVFKVLSFGWGFWLLIAAINQLMLVAVVSPGTFIAVERPMTLIATAVGITWSLSFVRRRQLADPELGLLPARAAA
jgi:hypothetical protein